MKAISAALVLSAAMASPAASAVKFYDFSGEFTNGRQLSGSFSVDDSWYNEEAYTFDRIQVEGYGYFSRAFSIRTHDGVVEFGLENVFGDLRIVFPAKYNGYIIEELTTGALDEGATSYNLFERWEPTYLKAGSSSITLRSEAAVPEPGTWALMILGFGVVGYALRRRNGRLIAA